MNENKNYFYLIAGVLFLGFVLWYIFGDNIPDNRSGADAVELSQMMIDNGNNVTLTVVK